jgi:hypothetical protein
MTDEQLLDLRLCDLPLRIAGTPLEGLVARLYEELETRGLRFKPHVWLSEDWFTPDKVSGFAIPFYLAHPRLIKLERRQMLQVEGGSENECLRIMRHEVGHAIDNALTQTGTNPSLTAAITWYTFRVGTRRRTPRKTSRRLSPCGWLRGRAGEGGTKGGARAESWSTSPK